MSEYSTDAPAEVKLLSFDIDNTLIDFHTFSSNFKKVWESYKPKNVFLVYNSGRLIDDILNLIEKEILPQPDYIISGVGTHIYNFNEKKLIKEFNHILDDGWDLKVIEKLIEYLDHPISE